MKKILGSLLVAAMLLTMGACGKKEETASDAVAKQLESFKANADELLGSTDIPEEGKEVYELIYKCCKEFDYKIVNEAVDGDDAVVTVEFNTYELGKATVDALTEYVAQLIAAESMSEEESEKILYEVWAAKIKEVMAAGKTYSKTVDVNISKVNGVWNADNISNDANLLDALMGGFYSEMDNY